MKGLRMFTALTLMELAHTVLFLAGSFGAWLTGHLSAFSLAVVYSIALALPLVLFGAPMARVLSRWPAQRTQSAGDRLYTKLLRFSVWTTLAGVTWQVLVYYPVWYLNRAHGSDAVAVFAAVRQVGQFILLGAIAISMVVTSTVTKTWESRGRAAAREQLSLAFRCTGLGLLVLSAAVALAKGWVVMLFSAKYAAGADILPLQLLFFLIGAYLAFLPIHFQLIEKTRHMFWPWAIGVGANVVIAFWLAGPRFAVIRDSAVWQRAGSIVGLILPTGFSGPQGLDAAAWCGVLAIGLALAMCVSLIRAERCPLDRGTYVVILSAALLAARTWILAAGVAALLIVAWQTELILTAAERRRLLGQVAEAFGRTPVLGRYLTFRGPPR
jgi:Na+-driven multidrug efflux pump